MPISGVVILTKKDKTQDVLEALKKKDNITTYGVHKDFHIITVFEADTAKGLENIADDIQDTIPGILGIYPSYINFEDEVDEDAARTSE